jgi:hypothetical protein
MTQALDLPAFRTRAEGDHHIVFVPDPDAYFVVDQTTLDVLDELRAGSSAAEAAERIAGADADSADAEAAVEALIRVLRGEALPPASGQLSIRPLSDMIGGAADRCETFGMPL